MPPLNNRRSIHSEAHDPTDCEYFVSFSKAWAFCTPPVRHSYSVHRVLDLCASFDAHAQTANETVFRDGRREAG